MFLKQWSVGLKFLVTRLLMKAMLHDLRGEKQANVLAQLVGRLELFECHQAKQVSPNLNGRQDQSPREPPPSEG
jgi:hypothetical protein